MDGGRRLPTPEDGSRVPSFARRTLCEYGRAVEGALRPSQTYIISSCPAPRPFPFLPHRLVHSLYASQPPPHSYLCILPAHRSPRCPQRSTRRRGYCTSIPTTARLIISYQPDRTRHTSRLSLENRTKYCPPLSTNCVHLHSDYNYSLSPQLSFPSRRFKYQLSPSVPLSSAIIPSSQNSASVASQCNRLRLLPLTLSTSYSSTALLIARPPRPPRAHSPQHNTNRPSSIYPPLPVIPLP